MHSGYHNSFVQDMLLTLLPSSEQIEFISRGNTCVTSSLTMCFLHGQFIDSL